MENLARAGWTVAKYQMNVPTGFPADTAGARSHYRVSTASSIPRSTLGGCMRTERWFPILLVAAVPLVACRQQPDQGAVQDELPAAEPAPGTEEQAAPEAMGEAQPTVAVENAMPHPMVVYRLQNGERVELGTVDAGATETFSLPVAAGETVDLVAADLGETHQVEESVVASGDTATWTLGS